MDPAAKRTRPAISANLHTLTVISAAKLAMTTAMRSSCAERSMANVLILENRGYDLAAVGIVCLYDCATSAPPGSDGTVSHALPYAAFAILGLVRLVGATCKVDTADTEVVGDDGGGCSAGNARHFNFNAEVLALNRDHLCALHLVQLCSVLVVGDGVAATVLDDLDRPS